MKSRMPSTAVVISTAVLVVEMVSNEPQNSSMLLAFLYATIERESRLQKSTEFPMAKGANNGSQVGEQDADGSDAVMAAQARSHSVSTFRMDDRCWLTGRPRQF